MTKEPIEHQVVDKKISKTFFKESDVS